MAERDYSPNDACWASSNSALLRIKGANNVLVVPITRVHTWWMHWATDLARTVPCLADGCRQCRDFTPRRPLSYLGVIHYGGEENARRWRPQVLEVPLSCGIALIELRNTPVALRRVKRLGPVQVGTWSPKEKPPMCQPWDILPGLMRMWRIAADSRLSLVENAILDMVNVAHC